MLETIKKPFNYEGGAIRYAHEYPRRLRVCAVGAGRHPYFNTLPVLRFAPVDLVGISDLNEERAEAAARAFGATKAYTDHREMFAAERPEAVFIVTSYDKDGRSPGTQIALDAIADGANVWMEKPTGVSVHEIEEIKAAADAAGKTVMTGLKKMFTPGVERVKEIISNGEFGTPASITVRYPQIIPPMEERGDLHAVYGLLDHIWHPMATILHLMGTVDKFTYEWEPKSQSSILLLRFASGAIGTLHFAAGISGSSPLERVEVVGQNANVVLENGVDLTYYRPSPGPDYGGASYLVPTESAALTWSPEFSHGALFNNGNFLLGYFNEINQFCHSVLAEEPVTKGTLDQCLEIIRIFEAIRTHPSGVFIDLKGDSVK